MVDVQPISSWAGAAGEVVCWLPTPASRAAMAAAPLSAIPPSRQQEQHLRAYRRFRAAGMPMARVITVLWEEPGRCDLPAMTRAITGHLRRHDTYRSWFAFDEQDRAVRHHARHPADVEVEPMALGHMDAALWRDRMDATPGPLTWDCFSFGVVQHEERFTVFAGIDHVHADAWLVPLLFRELHGAYAASDSDDVLAHLPQAGSYLDYCRQQDSILAALGPDSPPVRAWLEFFEANGGALPRFPLDIGEDPGGCLSHITTFRLLDTAGSRRFEAACAAVGARPLGGLLACAALTQHALIGQGPFAVVTPTTTRTTPADHATSGWFTGVVPIQLHTTAGSFWSLAPAAQAAFAANLPLARVPVERVAELASPPLALPGPGGAMLSYMDADLPPMDAVASAELHRRHGRLLLNRGAADQVALNFTRSAEGLTLAAAIPDNPAARSSITRYVRTFAGIIERVAAVEAA